jgi:hypothetical protein
MKKVQNIPSMWRALPKETLLAIAKVSGSDGHTIFKPSAYEQAGMTPDLLAHFTETIKSDRSDYKRTITAPDGRVLDKLTGVYGLRVVESIASALDIHTGSYMGRGFRASAAYSAIVKHLDGGKGEQ